MVILCAQNKWISFKFSAKADAKGKKPVPKKPADKAPATEEKKAPARAIQKAQKVQKKTVKGTHGTRVKKIRTSVHFRRPKTFRPVRQPKYPRKSTPARNRMGEFAHFNFNGMLFSNSHMMKNRIQLQKSVLISLSCSHSDNIIYNWQKINRRFKTIFLNYFS